MTGTLTGHALRSLITADGQLRLSLEPIAIEEPGPGELVVRVEAAPINPSDLGVLMGPADASTLRTEGTAEHPILVADVPSDRLAAIQGRLGQSLPLGNEGAGTVVSAGAGVEHLVGRKVGIAGGGMYATHRKIHVDTAILLPVDASAAEGASLFVNPRTALGFVETMRMDGHTALVHTAAASNLGQMLVRICLADGIPLVNIVRSEAQAALLRGLGAVHVVDSSRPDFREELIEAIAATGATMAFDAVGGGRLAGQILEAMEAAALRKVEGGYSRYGSGVMRLAYIYGTLDSGPTVFDRIGYSWKVDGWLLTQFAQRAGPEVMGLMRQRVVDELRTTFASHYAGEISLLDALKPEIAKAYERKGTGAKYLINPSL